jgi:hypothetical protein
MNKSVDQLQQQDEHQIFFEYINYDWNDSKDWIAFQAKLTKDARETKSVREQEEQRRKFYVEMVD